MTDKKFIDEEIIKRLEQCVKRGNRNYDTDIVLDLINRHKEQIKELKEKYAVDHEQMKSEYYYIKAEAYKEFAERLKEKQCDIVLYGEIVTVNTIDNLLKEMVGEEE